MSQVTTHAYRILCKETGGCGLVCTELVSSKAIQYRNERTFGMLDWREGESPVAVQLFGNDPEVMAIGAAFVEDMGAEIVDINMGCWVPKVAGKGAGAALLKDVATATAVVDAVVKAVNIPVTVKVRAGFEMNRITAIDFARAAQDVGVAMIAVHGRFAEQGFKGEADWSIIRRVKEVVSIPVLGNGDILTPQDAERMLIETGVDGVMIGRAAIGNPWIFGQIEHYLRTGEELPQPSDQQRVEMAIRHARLSVETSAFEERQVCLRLRSQLPPYLAGIPGKRWANEALKQVSTLTDAEDVLLQMLERHPLNP
jgi:nifR3 family TIM-barrel protein